MVSELVVRAYTSSNSSVESRGNQRPEEKEIPNSWPVVPFSKYGKKISNLRSVVKNGCLRSCVKCEHIAK